MPVREIQNRAGKHITGAVPSPQLDRMVLFEGLTERAYIYLLNHDPRVRHYEEQPVVIHYRFKGRARYYAPDFKVEWTDRKSSIVECKPAHQMEQEANRRKWTAARLWCEEQGYTFSVVTDELVKQHAVLLDNLSNIAGHASARFAPQTLDYVLAAVQSAGGSLTVDELVSKLPRLRLQVARACVWHLLAAGTLTADLTQKLHVKRTVVTLAGGSRG